MNHAHLETQRGGGSHLSALDVFFGVHIAGDCLASEGKAKDTLSSKKIVDPSPLC